MVEVLTSSQWFFVNIRKGSLASRGRANKCERALDTFVCVVFCLLSLFHYPAATGVVLYCWQLLRQKMASHLLLFPSFNKHCIYGNFLSISARQFAIISISQSRNK